MSKEIEKRWRAKKPAPVYVVTGEEDYLRNELLHLAADIFLPESEGGRDFNLSWLYGSDPNVTMDSVLTTAAEYPLMCEWRVVVVREADKIFKARSGTSKSKKKGNTDPLAAYLVSPNRQTLLIFETEKLGPKNQSPFKELAQHAELVDFPQLKDLQAAQWIEDRAKSLGKRLQPDAARLMVAQLGSSLYSHVNELEKLITYTADRSEITSADVEEVVGVSRSYNIFELTKAIGRGDARLSTEIALYMLEQDKDQRQPMLVMLSRFLEQMILTQEALARGEGKKQIIDILELKGGQVYFVDETIANARRYSRRRLDEATRAIVEIESRSRRIKIDEKLFMEDLLLHILPDRA